MIVDGDNPAEESAGSSGAGSTGATATNNKASNMIKETWKCLDDGTNRNVLYVSSRGAMTRIEP